MRRKLLLSFILLAVHSVAWAQGTAYAKLTNGDEVSWAAIRGTISDTEIADIMGFQLAGVLDLSQVYTDEGGTGTALRVTSIGSFMDCDAMTGVTIPSSVTSIGSGAFRGCSALTSLDIPSSVTSIGSDVFSECTALVSVTLPSTMTSIGRSMFSNCSSLASVTIPSGVTTIDSYAFYGCTSLEGITIPANVTSIGSDVFEGCTALSTIAVDAGNETFNDGDGSNVIIETASNTLMIGCKGSVIPSGVTTIGERAFVRSGLTSIAIPASVTTIGNRAFLWCTDLSAITVDAGNGTFNDGNGSNVIIETASNTLVVGCKGSVIPYGVTTIGEYAFEGSSIESITIPSSVTKLENYAFGDCKSLTSVTIPSSVTSIENRVFAYCSYLTSSYIPASVTNIGRYAFGYCGNLANVYLYHANLNTLTVAGDAFFYWSSSRGLVYHALAGSSGSTQTNALSIVRDIPTTTAITANQDPGNAGIYYATYYNGLTDCTMPGNVKIYTGEVDGSTLRMTEINSDTHLIPACTPVVLKGTAASITATINGTATAFDGTNHLQGTGIQIATASVSGNGTIYTLAAKDGAVGFYRYTGENIAANKAFLQLTGSGAAAARLSIQFGDEPGTTGIGDAGVLSDNGQQPLYDLQGRRVTNARRGLYIKNGKKVFIGK
mgnify:FL=1